MGVGGLYLLEAFGMMCPAYAHCGFWSGLESGGFDLCPV